VLLNGTHLFANSSKVLTSIELSAAIKNARPGDTIVMAKGNWKNTELLFEANGTKQNPIVIMAEVAGKTLLTGNSWIKFAGNNLVINGLYLTDGFAENVAIEFRKNDKILANNARLTNCTIDNYSKPNRMTADSWIVMWGKNNRIDHCTIGDKLNAGTTLIIELNDERSQQNFHSIDSNYFYKHSPLGSNGGETIRIGVSRYSLTSSNTIITHNYFEQCSGEVEIISVKSCYNTVSQNTFFECEGGVVLRHGNHNLIEGNLFIGNNKPYTGGIRVINPNQTVMNNLLLDCAGLRFRSALGVLNGVPNSQLNRYFQVKDSKIINNSFIHCASIVFGAGKDHERTLSPQNVAFENNFIFSEKGPLYEDLNKDGGIILKNNTTNQKTNLLGINSIPTKQIVWNGFTFIYPTKQVGADLSKVAYVDKNKVGADWYVYKNSTSTIGKCIEVKAAESKKINALIASANNNDTLVLMDNAQYPINEMLLITKPISIIANTQAEFVNVSEKSLPSFISIENGGSLFAKGLHFNSAYKSFGDVQSAVITTTKPMLKHYNLTMQDCLFYNFNENNYACFRANKSTFGDAVVFDKCIFRNMSGSAIDMSSEKDDKGMYNAENIVVKNCVFYNMLANAISIYRGGNDESTTGPSVTIDHCIFNDVDNREQGAVIKLLGVQYARVLHSSFYNCGQGGRSIWFEELAWDDIKVDDCNFYNAGKVQSFHGNLLGNQITHVQPKQFDINNPFQKLY
jgi:poly(beta-D-mannuronate) lyase